MDHCTIVICTVMVVFPHPSIHEWLDVGLQNRTNDSADTTYLMKAPMPSDADVCPSGVLSLMTYKPGTSVLFV
ncbi:unnamed protein product [Ceratitis capitata]|uniref:(Mediterranean fruit fly) hypothetical protein n=1 Tax=Ceratitis capitata TaxID=7213 RepID=A0A811UKZ5_CERCA|nr:unnamed protein product [Ceratitis capitata]